MALMTPAAMFTKNFNEVVCLALASTPGELREALAPLPHGVRYGVACDLEGRLQLGDRLNGEAANQIFSKATQRRVDLPIPTLEPHPIRMM